MDREDNGSKKQQEAHESDGDSVYQDYIVSGNKSKKNKNGSSSKVTKSSQTRSPHIAEPLAIRAPCFDDSFNSFENNIKQYLRKLNVT